MNVSKECLNSEMTVAKNVLVKNIGSDVNIEIFDVIRVLSENQTQYSLICKNYFCYCSNSKYCTLILNLKSFYFGKYLKFDHRHQL
jgi:hypothetical protein